MEAIVAVARNPAGSGSSGVGGLFFAVGWVILIVGGTIHVFADRKPNRRTARRVVEIYLIWLMAGGGVWAIIGGLGHISGNSDELAETIGYAPSMFQWEVGWGDIAVGVLGFVCIWKRNGWLTAAVVALALSYGGDAIGHIMQWTVHDNTAPDNVWAIPSDVAQPLIAIVLLVVYRRYPAAESRTGADASTISNADDDEPPARDVGSPASGAA